MNMQSFYYKLTHESKVEELEEEFKDRELFERIKKRKFKFDDEELSKKEKRKNWKAERRADRLNKRNRQGRKTEE